MNDLIGLGYGWQHRPGDGSGLTDCFQLTCEVRDRMGLTDYRERFAWVYEQWEDATFPRRMIVRWLLEHGCRLQAPCPGAVALLPGHAGAALATVVDRDLILLGPGQNVVRAMVPAGAAHYFWMDK